MENNLNTDYVLIVDDSPGTLKFLTDVMEGAGVSVLVAPSGAKALEVIEEVVPAAILMDAMMPEMDGFETCRRIKQNRFLRYVPVIFMTGLSETEHIVRGFEAGGVDYLIKPVVPDELIARVLVHLRNAKIAQVAYVAMDEAHRHLLAATADGKILWSTPQANALIDEVFGGGKKLVAAFPSYIVNWLKEHSERHSKATQQLVLSSTDKRQLLLSYIGKTGPNELLLRILDDSFLITQTRLAEKFKLTQRESAVLAWIATGKTNRDIGVILDLSPRTINKHMERIHQKLGVETRTAAAAAAFQVL